MTVDRLKLSPHSDSVLYTFNLELSIMIKKTSLWLTVFCLFLFVPAAWAQGFHHRGGTLVIGRSADSVTLDPARSNDTESSKVISNIFEGLVRYKDDSLEVEPALASAWETYNDGRMWIFHLRKGVRFHDGTPFNAEAVVFSISRQIDPQHPFFNKDLNIGCLTFKYVKEVKALDEYLVLIILEKTYAPFLHNLAMANSAPIVSSEAVKKWGNNDFEKHPSGTGPFRFSEWIPNDRIVLTENREYWGGPPRLDRVIFRTIPNDQERFKEFQYKRIDVLDGLTAGQYEKLKKNSLGVLLTQAGLNIGYLAMNVEKKPFDQIKVRQAVNYAINKRKIITLFYNNMAIRAANPTPPVISGYSENIAGYAYNPRKARQMLKEAGCGNGFETTLWVMKSARPYMPEPVKIAESIRSDLAAVGIKVRLAFYDWKTYLDKLGNGEHDMCLIGWTTDNGDADNFLYTLLDQDNAVKPHARNFAFFKHKELHDILINAQQTLDEQTRLELYHKAEEIIRQQAPWVPIAHTQQLHAFQRTAHDVIFSLTGDIKLYKAWVE